MMYEMRLGFDGTMPGAPYSDVYAQIWDLYQSGQQAKARDLFSKLLLMLECEQQIPGTRQYMMKKRSVFRRPFHASATSILMPKQSRR